MFNKKVEMNRNIIFFGLVLLSLQGCGKKEENNNSVSSDETMSCASSLPSRYANTSADDSTIIVKEISYEGMVQIPEGEYLMSASDDEGRQDEYPQHKIKLNGFCMDATEVTNAQFKKFVEATGYVTTAEIKPD